MIASLYNKFQHWSAKGSIWLISDPHFDDEDSLLMNPNWLPADQYVEILNKNIFKNDTLICLGDCGNLDYFRKLKAGHRVLIKGNHDDKGDDYYRRKIFTEVYDADEIDIKELKKKLSEKYPYHDFKIDKKIGFSEPFNRWVVTINNKLFNEVYSGALFIGDKILLSHEPINGLKFCCNIHGHVHNGVYDYTDSQGGRHLNIASDVIGWQPLNLGKAIKCGLIAGVPTIHRLTIDRANETRIHELIYYPKVQKYDGFG